MMSNFHNAFVFAAMGAGTVLGAAGLFIYHRYFESRRCMSMQQEITQLDITISQLKAELEAARLRKSSRPNSPTRSVRSFKSARSGRTSYFDSDEDDEFFDISSDADDEFDSDFKNEDSESQSLFEMVDALLKTGTEEDSKEAYNLLKNHMSEHGRSCGLLWRLAKSCHGRSSASATAGKLEERKEFLLEGIEYAKRALELDSSEAEAHKWFAVLTGAYGDFLGMKERIEGGYVFKTHVEKAIDLRPEDASLRHLIGRFKYEVACLSWIERKVAGTLFAELPAATVPEAIEDFLSAGRLSEKPWKDNSLYLAKCCIAEGKYTEALKWLDDAARIPVATCQDELAELEVQKLLVSYSGYRKS